MAFVPFSFLWGGFAIFWETSVIRSGAPFFFMLWGIPFVLVGLYLIVGRFFADAWLRSGTHYGVTDRRILIQTSGFGRRLTSIDRTSMPPLTLEEFGNGRATIYLGASPDIARGFDAPGWPANRRYRVPALEQIDDGRKVFELLQAAR